MLSNPRFVDKAPAIKITEEKNKLSEYIRQRDLVLSELEKLS